MGNVGKGSRFLTQGAWFDKIIFDDLLHSSQTQFLHFHTQNVDP